jgi:hypothetical protein
VTEGSRVRGRGGAVERADGGHGRRRAEAMRQNSSLVAR